MLLSTSSDFNSRSKTITVGVLLTLLLIFSFSSLRHESWLRLYDFFLWLETTPFGVLGKTWGAVFAIVEAVHLLAMALLGGAVLISDARLLGWCFTDVPAVKIQNEAHKVFKVGLVVVLFTGGVLFYVECCIRQLSCPSIISRNITSITHNMPIYSYSQ